MTRSLTILCSAVAALGFTLANPQSSQAQTPFGLQLNVGPAGFNYQQGYPAPYGVPRVVAPAPYVVPGPVVTAVPAPYVYPRPYYYSSYPYYGRGPVVVPYRGYNRYYRR